MAETHTLICTGVQIKTAQTCLGLLNGDATQKLLIRRAGFINPQIPNVSPSQKHEFHINRRTATATWTPGTAITPFYHDTTNSALSSATAGYGDGGAWAGGSVDELRTFELDGDDPSGNGVLWYDWESIVPYGIVWEVGYGYSGTIDPLTLNEDEGFYIYGDGGGSVNSFIDFWCEFTNET
jgi:hypothetical protein